jgi:phosphatidyl-myo-inositol alpha-mannosyltransferase
MRVAMVSPYDLAVPGGVQGQVRGLATALRRLGHEVLVVAPGPPRVTPDEVTVGRAIGVRANGSVAPVSVSPLAALRAARATRWSDVVHLHEPLAPVIAYGCLLSARAPVVGTFHRNGASPLYGALRPAVRFVSGRLAARCAVSEAARDNVARYAPGEFEVLFNGVDLEPFARAVPSERRAPTVLFVGRHEPRKGLGVLLQAFAKSDRDAELWVIGEGPATDQLRRRFPPSRRLRWLGAIDDGEKAARMVAADVVAAPSLGGESFGVVLLEAMAARCAVVASDIDGYRDAAGAHARLVPPGDPDALAAALDDALAEAAAGTGSSSPGALDEARAHAERWSMSRLAERYEQIYERVLSARRNADGGAAVR